MPSCDRTWWRWSRDLRVHRKIGSGGHQNAVPAVHVLVGSGLDDRTWARIAGQLREKRRWWVPRPCCCDRGVDRPENARVSEKDIDPQRLILLEEGRCLRDRALAYCASTRRDVSLGATSLATALRASTLAPPSSAYILFQKTRLSLSPSASCSTPRYRAHPPASTSLPGARACSSPSLTPMHLLARGQPQDCPSLERRAQRRLWPIRMAACGCVSGRARRSGAPQSGRILFEAEAPQPTAEASQCSPRCAALA
jgi:hypothetical protein